MLSMKKTLLLFSFCILVLVSTNAQTVLTQWTWTIADTSAATYTTASVGTGSISFLGNVYGGTQAKWSAGVKTGTYRLSSTNYPTGQDSSGITGTVFATSTVGHYGIIASYYFKDNSAASRYHQVKYTTDGTNWQTLKLTAANATAVNVTAGGDFQVDTVNNLLSDSGSSTKVVFGKFTIDFSGIAGVDNNPLFKFFVTPTFGPGNTAYVPANSAKTYVGGNATTACIYSFDSVTVSYISNAPLPVLLTSFNATLINGSTRLSWNTTNEVNILNYDLQKSTDGINFKDVNSTVADKQSTYSFTDIATSNVTYYRIKINSKDGRFTYSNIISVHGKVVASGLIVFPNPARNTINVSYNRLSSATLLSVYNLEGKLMLTTSLPEGSTQSTVAVNELKSGKYVLVLNNNNNQQTTMLIKE